MCFVREKGSVTIVTNDLVTVSFDNQSDNYNRGFRKKGEVLQLILKVNAKSHWKGWLKIGFETEIREVPYVYFPIAFR